MSTIIFDFDGTLADSIVVMLEIYNELANSRGMRAVTLEDWNKLRQGTIAKGLKWSGAKPYQLPGLLAQGLKLVEKRTADIKLFPEMISVVNELDKKGHVLFVLSTNSQHLIQEVLNKHEIGDKLTVLKSSKVFGKASALRKLIKTNKLDKENTWMVGDEVRDMVAANKAGINTIGVNWGFQPGDTLKKSGNVTIANKPQDILNIIN